MGPVTRIRRVGGRATGQYKIRQEKTRQERAIQAKSRHVDKIRRIGEKVRHDYTLGPDESDLFPNMST